MLSAKSAICIDDLVSLQDNAARQTHQTDETAAANSSSKDYECFRRPTLFSMKCSESLCVQIVSGQQYYH